jgi:chromosome segregation ATPase
MADQAPARLHRTLPSPQYMRPKTAGLDRLRVPSAANEMGLERSESGCVVSTLRSIGARGSSATMPPPLITLESRVGNEPVSFLPALSSMRFGATRAFEASANRNAQNVDMSDTIELDGLPFAQPEPETRTRATPMYAFGGLDDGAGDFNTATMPQPPSLALLAAQARTAASVLPGRVGAGCEAHMDVEKSWYGLVRQQDVLLQGLLKKEEFDKQNLEWHVSQSREAFRQAAVLQREHTLLREQVEQLRGQLAVPTVLLTQHEERMAALQRESLAHAHALEAQLDTAHAETDALRTRLTTIEEELKKKTTEATDLGRALTELQRRAMNADSECTQLRAAVDMLQRECDTSRADISGARASFEELLAESEQRAAAAQEQGARATQAAQQAGAHVVELEQALSQQKLALASAEARLQDTVAAGAQAAELHAVETRARADAIASLETQRALSQKRHDENAARAAAQITNLLSKNEALSRQVQETEAALVAARQEISDLTVRFDQARREAAAEIEELQIEIEKMTKEQAERTVQGDAVATATARLTTLEQQCALLSNLQVDIQSRHRAETAALTEQLRARDSDIISLRASLAARTAESERATAAAREAIDSRQELMAALQQAKEALTAHAQEIRQLNARVSSEEGQRAAATARAANAVTTAAAAQHELQDLRSTHAAILAELEAIRAKHADEARLRVAQDAAVAALELQLAAMHAKDEETQRIVHTLQAQLAALREASQPPQASTTPSGAAEPGQTDSGVSTTHLHASMPRPPSARPVSRQSRHRHCFPMPVSS